MNTIIAVNTPVIIAFGTVTNWKNEPAEQGGNILATSNKILHNKILFYQDGKQRRCAVRILTYIDGDMYAKSKNTDHTEQSLGRLLALQSTQLQSFIKNQAIRKFEWNPSDIRWTKKFINLFLLLFYD